MKKKNIMWMPKKIFFLFVWVIFLTCKTAIGQDAYNRFFYAEQLRINYYHTGNADTSFISDIQFVKDPVWGGNHKNLVDTFYYGKYYIEVYDALSGQLIYSRGFSTLLDEYTHTKEAQTSFSVFPECIILPFPQKAIRINYKKRDFEDGLFKDYAEFWFNPKKDIIKNSKTIFKALSLHEAGPASKKLDVTIVPEGYRKEDSLKMMEDAQKMEEWFFSWSPYKKYKKSINIRLVLAWSDEEGISLIDGKTYKQTVLQSQYYTFGNERYLMVKDLQNIYNAISGTPTEQIVVMANSDLYGGGGIYNFYSTYAARAFYSEFLMHHEFAHAFAGLADEYYTSEVAYENIINKNTEPWQPNITTLVAFDKKWKDMLAKSTPIPTPAEEKYEDKTGVFEGAGYVPEGIYRPTLTSSMKEAINDAFGPINEEAIKKMIDFYSSE